MADRRRVALLILAANLAAAEVAFAQNAQSPGGGAGAGGAAADDEEEDEEEPSAGGARAGGAQAGGGGGAAQAQGGAQQSAGGQAAAGLSDFPTGAPETEEQAYARRERMLPRYSALNGAIGLLHMNTAEVGSDHTFRFGLIAEYFGSTGFLRPTMNMNHPMTATPDQASHIGATLTLSYSPIRYLEIFTALRSFANANNQERPSLFQVLGDATLGVKGVYPIFRGFNLGLLANLALLNRAGDIGLAFNSTSADFRLVATFDVGQYAPSVPIRFHLNFGYYLDNSAVLVQDVENIRRMRDPRFNAADCNMAPSTDPNAARNRNPACHIEISRIERYALQINRTDRLNINIGVDANLPYVRPFIEYSLMPPVVRQGYICYEPSTGGGDDDRCLDSQMGRFYLPAMPSILTIGARIVPPIRGLSGLLAVDIATTGSGTFVRELAPTAPWTVYFGAAFAHDFAPQVRRVEVPVDRPRDVIRDVTPANGTVVGTVIDAENRQPINGAIADFVGHPDFGLYATSAQGVFRARMLPPGDYEVHVRAPDYTDNTCRTTIPQPQGESRSAGDIAVECALRPVARAGAVSGRVTSNGQGVGGVTVTLTPGAGITVPQGQNAPTPITATTGGDGSFNFANVLAGTWSIAAGQGPNTMASTPRNVDVVARQTANADLQVSPVNTAGIRITPRAIEVRDAIHFQTDSAEILPDSNTLIERIADFMNRHPEAQQIEIQGHTDNQGPRARNTTLSQQRAEAVRAALVNLGVSADRLTARGYGPDRPRAPNLTAAGRARNRRVEFIITRRGR